ncbi:MAG: branched-chain amino acid transaminase [Bacteroidetes bacterium]|jgi:branched-chain amino acid aminotransferase|nr:branched-chain amino acid transaminase [Bacteroidota bacterium]
MPVKPVDTIWMNGRLVKWDEAKVHVLSHVIHYGSSWFEGIRCYDTKRGSGIFRLDAHLRRLYDSCKIYRATIPYSKPELEEAIKQTIRANGLKACYIRPIVYRGYGEVGVNPVNCPIDVSIAVWEWGTYLGPEALEHGIDVGVSSWRRPAPDTLPTVAKSGGNYLNSQLIRLEAMAAGYAEGIALDVFGHVSEGSGENIFLVREKTIFTPPIAAALLPGVTRSTVMTLARELGYPVVEMNIPREMLSTVEEVFFTGTAAEITPVRSVDRITVGEGHPGPVTRELQAAFFDVIKNGNDKFHWLSFL